MRTRRVAADALDVDGEMVGRRHDRAGADRELADRQARIVVHAVDFADPEAVHHAVLDHRLAAGAALFRRLEDDDRGAGEIARLGEIARGAEQHRGVAVMAAGVHLAGRRRLVREVGGFHDRQRIHVGAQPDRLYPAVGRLAAMDDADHAGPADAGDHLVAAEALELVRHRGRGPVHVVEQFRMRVKVVAPFGDVAVQGRNAVDDRHWCTPPGPANCEVTGKIGMPGGILTGHSCATVTTY